MIKKLLLVASIATISSTTAMADLSGAQGTMKNVDSAINNAVQKAQRLFEQNNGASMDQDFSVINTEKNPYLSVLRITKDYRVEIKFAGDAKKTDNYTTPVAKGLLGMDIVLVPVYAQKDEKISSWECVTNADRNVQEFIGDASTKEYSASYIREASDNTYLSLCTYINKDLVAGSGSSTQIGRE